MKKFEKTEKACYNVSHGCFHVNIISVIGGFTEKTTDICVAKNL